MVNFSHTFANLFFTAIKTPDTAAVVETSGSKIFEIFGWLLNKVPLFFAALAIVFVSFILAGIVRKGVKKSLSSHNTDDQVVILVSKVTYIGVLIIGFTIALEVLGIDISGVVGLIGLGLGFAIQDIIKNFVSGALILIQEPFKIGDVIKVGEYLGKVENIEARSTNIKTFDGQRVIIPNADLFSSSVVNFSSHPERRLEIMVGVHYKTDLNHASRILMNVMTDHTEILTNPSPAIFFKEFADSSINISVKFWLDRESNIFIIKSDIIGQIKQAFDKEGIEIPFPIRTLDFPSNVNKKDIEKDLKGDVSNVSKIVDVSPTERVDVSGDLEPRKRIFDNEHIQNKQPVDVAYKDNVNDFVVERTDYPVADSDPFNHNIPE